MCGDVRYCICRSFKTLDNVKLSAEELKELAALEDKGTSKLDDTK